MYSDIKPCRACGSDVRLRPPQHHDVAEPDGPVDERVCTNETCETNRGRGADAPKP